MSKTCENCRYWGSLNSQIHRDTESFEARKCESGKIRYHDEEPLERDGLAYVDFETYNASAATGPDFGCIHFEKMEDLK